MNANSLIQAIIIGILITAPTGMAILICSWGNAAARREIYRLTTEIERLEQRHRTDLHCTMAIYADHKKEIAILNERHAAEIERTGAANLKEFTRGVEWERKRPERDARAARWAEKQEAEHKALREAWQ